MCAAYVEILKNRSFNKVRKKERKIKRERERERNPFSDTILNFMKHYRFILVKISLHYQ